MTRYEVDLFIKRTYGVNSERLFEKNPTTAVYRHPNGRKWFAIIMELSPKVFGLSQANPITVINLKIDSMLGDLLREKDGYFPAYHMNKEKWISVRIDDKTDPNELCNLIAMSHRLTKTKKDFE